MTELLKQTQMDRNLAPERYTLSAQALHQPENGFLTDFQRSSAVPQRSSAARRHRFQVFIVWAAKTPQKDSKLAKNGYESINRPKEAWEKGRGVLTHWKRGRDCKIERRTQDQRGIFKKKHQRFDIKAKIGSGRRPWCKSLFFSISLFQ